MKRILICVFMIATCMVATARTMAVATYNLRNANHSDSVAGNGWGQRLPYIAGIIRFHGFEIFGTQEGLHHQLQELKSLLPGYDYIGIGRDDGVKAGEHSAIFYDTAKFEVMEHGDFWLSENTDFPNKGWDAELPRICTWGRFKDLATGSEFKFYNLHQDHRGVEARKESVKLILRKIKEDPDNLPVIVTGDFNVDQNSEPYKILMSDGMLVDSYDTAAFRYAPNGTANGFSADRISGSRIDHVLLSSQFKVLKYGVLTDTYRSEENPGSDVVKNKNFPHEISFRKSHARVPSDHFPVKVIVDLPDFHNNNSSSK